MILINPRISISETELEFDFLRSSGPGGQNVNKVATAVQLRFDVRRSPSLPEEVRRRLEILAGRRLTAEGVLIIDARRHRTQEQNKADALAKLREVILRAVSAPKRRKKTKPTRSSIERRLKKKRLKGERKLQRVRKFNAD
jgi:ribosome-associated protein